LWAAVTSGVHRQNLLRSGKDIRTPFFVALTLDAIYQTITHEAIYLVELLLTGTLLAVVPYLLVRGPVNRLARIFSRHKGGSDVGYGNPE
jgi:hypothetical protein